VTTALDHPWTTPPEPGTTITVAPGVRWLRMPLPFQLNHINLWLLDDGDGVAIVDTGIGLPDTRAAWDRLFATELDGRPVTRVIVTHFHPDHMGNAGWLVDRTGVDLWCTEPEWLAAQRASRSDGAHDVERRLVHYRRHGFDDAALDGFRQRGNHYPRMVPSLAPRFRRLAEGDTLVIGGRRFDVFTVHGHAPDHACLWNREDRVLISGDQVLPKITTNVSVWPDRPDSNPLRQYLDSLARFRPMPADTLVLPSHGLPFRGLHSRLDGLARHHDDRLAETVGALTDPRTGAELIPVLFRRELDGHQLGFAIGEVLAHLHLLEFDGAVTRTSGRDEVYRFQRA
jgi:glyoxylase-like metal-dependent hydrolase (beta-lactamase superfamily II)